jgi:hypothetical protein
MFNAEEDMEMGTLTISLGRMNWQWISNADKIFYGYKFVL